MDEEIEFRLHRKAMEERAVLEEKAEKLLWALKIAKQYILDRCPPGTRPLTLTIVEKVLAEVTVEADK